MTEKSDILISVVSPVYQAEKLLNELTDKIIASVSLITEKYEIILVEDGSRDNSWKKIEDLCLRHSRVKGLKMSRNFGQHYAITAGLEASSGEFIIVMDCDLQDNPEEIPSLYNKSQEGFDMVLAIRDKRQDTFLKKLFSALFYKFLSYLTDTEQDYRIANFGLYRRQVIEAVLKMKEYNKYFPVMVRWVGYDVAKIPVKHAKRKDGKSSYTFSKYLHLALKIVLSFSEKPLWLSIKLGFIITLLSFIYGIYVLSMYFSGSTTVEGWASLIASVWFLGGLIIFILGVVGLYVGKSFEQVKNRPFYFIHKRLNLNE